MSADLSAVRLPPASPLSAFPPVQRPPEAAARPLVVSIPHAGTTIPQSERPYYHVDADTLLQDGDLYTDVLYDGAVAHGATVVSTPYSRFVVDLNRLPDDLSPSSAAGAVEKHAPGYYRERGVLWAVTTHAERIYTEPLPADVVAHRLHTYYHPYHDALSRELARLRDRFGYAVLLDAHSMPSRATALHADSGAKRTDIVPGNLRGRSCASWLTDAVCTYWQSLDYGVALNQPYQGGGITRRHGAPSEGIHAIQVELNRALYMDEQTFAPNAGFSALQADCLGLVARLASVGPG